MVEKVAWASGSARQTMRCETANRRENEKGVHLIRPNPPGGDTTGPQTNACSPPGRGRERVGSWRAPFRFFACIGTMNREQVIRHRQSAAGILPAVLFSEWSQDAGSTLGFMESTHGFDAVHWDHECRTSEALCPTCCRH